MKDTSYVPVHEEKCIEAIFKENMAASSSKFKEILSFKNRLYSYTDTEYLHINSNLDTFNKTS